MVAFRYFVLLFLISQACSTIFQSKVQKSFKKDKLVPDVLRIAPKKFVQVTYADDTEVRLGNELSVTSVAFPPKCVSWEADPNRYYTLAFVDPDALSRRKPSLRNVKHWLIVNIQGNVLSSGTTLAAYLPPTPGPGSGLHRYTFVVFIQPGCLNFNGFQGAVDRFNFDVKKFAKEYKLKPYAGNFFVAQTFKKKTCSSCGTIE